MKKIMLLLILVFMMASTVTALEAASNKKSANSGSVLQQLKSEEMSKDSGTPGSKAATEAVNTDSLKPEGENKNVSDDDDDSYVADDSDSKDNKDASVNSDSSKSSGLSGLPVASNLFRVTSKFGWRIHPVKKVRKMHTGIDLGVPKGTKLFAIGDGKVTSAGWENGYGYTVIVKHIVGAKTYFVRYAHLSKMAKVGTEVKKGEQIAGALTGNSGVGTAAHLHIEVREDDPYGEAIDPLKFISKE